MKLIFLDIDGVLNSGRSFIARSWKLKAEPRVLNDDDGEEAFWKWHTKTTIDPISVELLNKVLRDFDAKIVLSSTHRKHVRCEDRAEKLVRLQSYLTEFGVEGDRLIGWTPYLGTIRGVEISDWLNSFEHKDDVTHYIILDDSSDFLPFQMEFHVHCKGGHGITEENYREMTRLFGREDDGMVLL